MLLTNFRVLKKNHLKVHAVIWVKGEEQQKERTSLGYTSGDCNSIGFSFSQPHLLWTSVHIRKLLIPWPVEAGMVSLESLVWSSSWIKAMNAEVKSTTKLDPCLYPWACIYYLCVLSLRRKRIAEGPSGLWCESGEAIQDCQRALWPLRSQWHACSH